MWPIRNMCPALKFEGDKQRDRMVTDVLEAAAESKVAEAMARCIPRQAGPLPLS
jgi:hypothetical protein